MIIHDYSTNKDYIYDEPFIELINSPKWYTYIFMFVCLGLSCVRLGISSLFTRNRKD